MSGKCHSGTICNGVFIRSNSALIVQSDTISKVCIIDKAVIINRVNVNNTISLNKIELDGIFPIQGYMAVDVIEEPCNINGWITIKPKIIKPILKWTRDGRDKA